MKHRPPLSGKRSAAENVDSPTQRQTLADFRDHHRFVRELVRRQLRVDQFVADGQFEATALRRLQLKLSDALFEIRQQLDRQTDGLWLVISGRAIFQMNSHG